MTKKQKQNPIPKPIQEIFFKREQKHKENKLALFKLSFLFALIILASFLVISLILWLLVVKTTLINLAFSDFYYKPAIVLVIILISLIIGYAVAFAVGRLLISPIRRIITCFNKLSDGYYETRLSLKGPFSNYKAFQDFSKSFNNMAEELQHTELLSNDFINNFSHEFKTPIVSITGFAKLLKNKNISEEQKLEYINIIEEESLRLSQMTTNILNLIKIENQQLLSTVSRFNLSEQIRNCILLLENKWINKNFDFQIDFGEYYIWGNEELIKQIWINLLDNAIKFTPPSGIIKIDIVKNKNYCNISISNSGSFIPESSRERIFNKFYQADESHSSEGNGIGLAIVRKVVQLHQGYVTVQCQDNFTNFIISLPL